GWRRRRAAGRGGLPPRAPHPGAVVLGDEAQLGRRVFGEGEVGQMRALAFAARSRHSGQLAALRLVWSRPLIVTGLPVARPHRQTTSLTIRSAISSSDSPRTSCRTSSVCSPTRGEAPPTGTGWPSTRSGKRS